MNKRISILMFVVSMSAMIFQGCTEKAEDPVGGVTRSSYLGKWLVTETTKGSSYDVNITADPSSSDGVFISNFGNLGYSVPPAGASVSGSTLKLDPDQVIDGLKINGSGTLSGNKISLTYTINTGADLNTYYATYTKQ
jgi:hypothetical protein